MRRRNFLCGTAGLGGLVLSHAAGCGPIERVESTGGATWTERERQALSVVFASRRAAIVRHHLGPALRPWASNGVLAIGRGEEADSFDLTLNYENLLDSWLQELYGSAPLGIVMLIRGATIQMIGREAKVKAEIQRIGPRDGWVQVEHYQLWQSDAGWLIAAGRWMRVEETVRGEATRLGPYEWRRRDARVKEAREGSDTASLIEALRSAHRWPEAHDELERWTRRIEKEPQSPRTAAIWALRGRVAVEAGRPRDALPSFRMALRHDPQVKLPPFKAADDARATSS